MIPCIGKTLHRNACRAGLGAALALVIAGSAQAQTSQPPRAAPATQPKPAPAAASPASAARPQQPAAAARPAPATAAKPQAAPTPATAAQPARPAAASGPGGAAATLLASHGDWAVYTAPAGRSKICFASTQPKERLPKTLNRDPAYLFIAFRPAENIRNEVALVMGFPTKEGSAADAVIGNATYGLLTKEQNAWLRNPAEEGQAIATMSRGQSVVVKAQSRRGNALTDRYSLAGFAQALERARKECP